MANYQTITIASRQQLQAGEEVSASCFGFTKLDSGSRIKAVILTTNKRICLFWVKGNSVGGASMNFENVLTVRLFNDNKSLKIKSRLGEMYLQMISAGEAEKVKSIIQDHF